MGRYLKGYNMAPIQGIMVDHAHAQTSDAYNLFKLKFN